MYEYEITHNNCGMRTFIYGYNVADAFRRAKKDPALWTVESADYID